MTRSGVVRVRIGASALVALVAGCASEEPAAPQPADPVEASCTPGLTACRGAVFRRCEEGRVWVDEPCEAATLFCDPALGCVRWLESQLCDDGDGVCDEDGIPWRCGTSGRYEQADPCSEGTACVSGGVCLTCESGVEVCIDGDSWRCRRDRSAFDRLDRCDPRTSRCVLGACVSLCDLPDRVAAHEGCRFWAVDLDAVRLGPDDVVVEASNGLALLVGNVAADRAASVTVRASDGLVETEVAAVAVPAGGVERIDLPTRRVGAPARGYLAYRIDSDVPVAVVQLDRPAEDGRAGSADGSLLLPQAGLGREYVAVTGDARVAGDGTPWPAFVVVVGTTEEQVEVTLELAADFEAPEGTTRSGSTLTAPLSAFQVLAVPSVPPIEPAAGAANLSGSLVRATGPVAVFAGNVAARVPQGDGEACCAGHLEEQLPPVAAWGRRTVGGYAPRRSRYEPEAGVWRVTAGAKEARLSWAPALPPGAPLRLAPYESRSFEHAGAFLLEADAPVLVVQFAESSGRVGEAQQHGTCDLEADRGAGTCTLSTGFLAACTERPAAGGGRWCVPVGGPAMTVVPPVEQLRREALVLAPDSYALGYLVVLAPVAAVVRLDGELLDGAEAIALDGDGVRWARYATSVPPGAHRVEASAGVGVVAWGYDRGLAFAWPGGQNLAALR